MAGPRVLALVMAGGAGSRLDVLTDERPKPAMPYAGVYRLIDFPLSNCMHSDISDVWILQQYQPHSLQDHISNGRPWDLDRTYGGLRLLPPHQGREESGWHKGNADAIYRHKHFIKSWNADALVVVSADHVYKLDYGNIIDAHVKNSNTVTMVTTKVTRDDPSRFGVVEVDGSGRIVHYESKPDSPRSDIVTAEVFVFDPRALFQALEDEASSDDDEAGSAEDLPDILPRFVEGGGAYEYRLDGYWRDVGTIESYWASHMELLADEPPISLGDAAWPIHTMSVQRPPARIEEGARIERSLIAPGCNVLGRVSHSVLGPGVVVEEGAEVHDSVILHDCVVEAGARLERAILDVEARIGTRATAGAGAGSRTSVGEEDIVVIGRGAQIAPGSTLEPGERLSPPPSEG